MLSMHTVAPAAARPDRADACADASADACADACAGAGNDVRNEAPQDVQAQPEACYPVAVRTLCEFTARRGDLDLRFTPAPTAQEGIAGHQLVAARRPAHYQTEISLTGNYGPLLVRGRADGYDPEAQQLEEIKTHRGDLGRLPENHRHLHWAQVKVYGCLLCRKHGLAELNLALVYFDIVERTETVLVQRLAADELEAFFNDQCRRFLDWARLELAHRQRRDGQLQALRLPHASFRVGQRPLAEAVYKGAIKGRCLMVQAPTGIGKTIGTLFPLLKAAPQARLDKLYFLAAKASGRKLALDTLSRLVSAGESQAQPLALRVLELVAREKACEHPDKACHGESCPLARGFHDRLPAARGAALATVATLATVPNLATLPTVATVAGASEAPTVQPVLLDQAGVRALALAHQICPYYLSQELARWCDVVVGDYNYYFDLNAMLHAMAIANQWRVGLLVDEAHNLVDRARAMYSATLDQRQLHALRRQAPAVLRAPLRSLDRTWNGLHRDQVQPYAVCDSLPKAFIGAVQRCATAFSAFLADGSTAAGVGQGSDLLRFHFDVLHFLRLAEMFGAHSLFDISKQESVARGRVGRGRSSSLLCLRNVVPARFVAPRLAAAASSALFSATLGPRRYQADMLGLSQDTAWIDVASPFDASQLAVHVVDRISTRYRERGASVAPISQVIAAQYRRRPGNYLAFFSSYDYLERVARQLAQDHPDIPLREQCRGMKEAAQAEFLAGFADGGHEIAFAVLGGSFAEAIDLPGERLVGAFIATLGLPQVNPVNEQVRRRMQASFGAGYDYAYLFPGMQKVVQAAGRVIRTPRDRGVLYLIDDRFARPDVQRLLPTWWQIEPAPPAAGGEGRPGQLAKPGRLERLLG